MSETITRIALDQLSKYADELSNRGDRKSANDAMVLTHLVASLRANSERDLLMAEMAARFDELERTFHEERMLNSRAYQSLVSEFRQLQRQQDELRANQAVIAAVVDAGIDKISEVVKKMEKLSTSVSDVTEP